MAGPMGRGPRTSGEKAKDFKGTLIRLSRYLKPYRVGLSVVIVAAITSVIFQSSLLKLWQKSQMNYFAQC